jgi:hypothetical protein
LAWTYIKNSVRHACGLKEIDLGAGHALVKKEFEKDKGSISMMFSAIG